MNVGTIIENPMLKIKLGTKTLGNIEEVFIQNLSQGDSFIFAGQVLEFQSMKNNLVQVKRSKSLISKFHHTLEVECHYQQIWLTQLGLYWQKVIWGFISRSNY